MSDALHLRLLYRIEGGILDGTEICPVLAFILVKYPHRKTKDMYVPPMKTNGKETKTWHCCQDKCPTPDFEGDITKLVEHLMLHKGKLLKPWNKRLQLKSPIPAIKLPVNPWAGKEQRDPNATNHDRRFCLDLYIDSVKESLRRQGLEILEDE